MRGETTSDDKRKHLEFIQGVINRLSSNTFLFKGWSITIIVAVFTAMVTTQNYDLVWLNLGAILIFWFIDAYYLMLEQAYRKLYDKVAEMDAEKIDYKNERKTIYRIFSLADSVQETSPLNVLRHDFSRSNMRYHL